jgi:mono/diheme cytochrome c family protein
MRGPANLGILSLALSAALVAPVFAAPPDFAKDVQPIFKKRCFMCHNAKLMQNGVRFDDGNAALAGGYSGPVIIPGKSAESKVIQRVTSDKPGQKMPPAGPGLTPEEIATLKSWIDAGADWPRAAAAPAATPKSSHWAFQPVKKPATPEVKQSDWPANPIDNFILARLEAETIKPSPEADKATLLRRASLDLTGLPPTPAEVREFLDDKRDDAYERLVERLLSSPHYGEKMARQWLDLARYADSDGFEKDLVRPWAWRWRNWVIDAFNKDMPFDRFTVEQIAGDLLPHPSTDQLIATGFQRNVLTNREAGVDRTEARFDQLINRTATTGTVFLGLTVGCAQCHDHKYDPISQKDFYRLLAFYNASDETTIDAPLPGELGPWMSARPEYLKQRAHLLDVYEVASLQRDWEDRLRAAIAKPGADLEWDFEVTAIRAMVDGVERVLKTPVEQRTQKDANRLTEYFVRNTGPAKDRDRDCLRCLAEFRARLSALDAKMPRYSQAYVMAPPYEAVDTHIAIKGDYREKGLKVEPGTLSVLPELKASNTPTRLDLARWIASPDNPLTARVAVNRIWQEMFGRGLVRTSEDFGTMGDKPTHPELLDWLASEFVERGWSVKEVVRLIATSSTYRQSSHTRKDLIDKDPDNSLLARQSRVRLPAELIRDNALAAAGLLDTTIGGPSVRPPQPKGVAELGYAGSVKWTDDTGPARYRRGLYIHFQRTTPYPQLMNFDAPDSNVACSRRRRSNSPLQALNLLNDPVYYEAAQAMGYRLEQESSTAAGADARIDYAFQIALGRNPSDAERARMKQFLDGPGATKSPWVSLSRVLLNLDEFMTRE